jgi:hypothetical protein
MDGKDLLMEQWYHNMNKEELKKIQASWKLRQVERDSILASQKINLPGDSVEVKPPYEGLPAFSDMPKIPGIGEGSILDLFGKGIMYSGQAEQARSQAAIEAGKVAVEAVEPVVEPLVSGVRSLTADMLTGDYQRSVIAGAVGAPVDMANSLLSLLGIEMTYSDKPFMGSKHIKESLDYLSGSPYSTRFMVK